MTAGLANVWRAVLKAPYVTAKHGLIGLAKVVAKEGAAHNVRANVICPGFVRTPLVDKQIPEQGKELGITEQEVIKNVMLKETVDGKFTTVEDVAEAALFFAGFKKRVIRRTRESAVTRGFLSKDAIAMLKDEQAFGGMESVMRLWKNLAEM